MGESYLLVLDTTLASSCRSIVDELIEAVEEARANKGPEAQQVVVDLIMGLSSSPSSALPSDASSSSTVDVLRKRGEVEGVVRPSTSPLIGGRWKLIWSQQAESE